MLSNVIAHFPGSGGPSGSHSYSYHLTAYLLNCGVHGSAFENSCIYFDVNCIDMSLFFFLLEYFLFILLHLCVLFFIYSIYL